MTHTQAEAVRIKRGVGGKAFPKDYDWVCPCGYENRSFEPTCQACDHLEWINEQQ